MRGRNRILLRMCRMRCRCCVFHGLGDFHGQLACGIFFFILIFRKAKLVGDEKHRKPTKKKKVSGVSGHLGNLYRYAPDVPFFAELSRTARYFPDPFLTLWSPFNLSDRSLSLHFGNEI